MDVTTKKFVWGQFGAAIETVENAIKACPDDLWFDNTKYHQFWYVVSHTLFWLDYYLSDNHDKFKPPEPFGLEEMDPAGVIPDPPYTKDELLAYLEHGYEKCRTTIASMDEDKANEKYKFGKVDLSNAELLLYSMRHVQHHAAQLNLLLRQNINSAPGWVFTAKRGLNDD